MKNLMNKYFRLFVLLVLVVCIFVSSTACAKPKDTVDLDRGIEFVGTHIFTAPDVETDDYIVENGKFDYTLVLPADASGRLNDAKQEFILLFKRATGIEITSVIRDNGLTFNETDKYISFGDTELVKSAGIEYDKQALENDGARIITKGKTIFLLGGTDTGVIAAVYDFMTICFDYEYYYRDCVEIDTEVFNLKLKNFDVTDVPDILRRDISHGNGYKYDAAKLTDYKAYGDTASQEVYMRLSRYKDFTDYQRVLLPIFEKFDDKTSASMGFHNVMEYCPRNQSEKKWISDAGDQLCYTAHGDAESLQRMKEHCAKKIENTLKFYPVADFPYGNAVSLTMEDNGDHCTCSQCNAETAKDGQTRNGAVIRFINDVMDLVYEWMEEPENEPYRRDDLVCYFFAYSSSSTPPAEFKTSTGKWQALEGCEMGPHTGVYFAPNSDFCFYADMFDTVNKRGNDYLNAWLDISENFWFWGYGGFHRASTYYMNSENLFNNDFFRLLAKENCSYFFNEVIDQGETGTGWNNLKTYTQYKLSWDSNLNVEEITKNYFNAMYKDASDSMYELYQLQRKYFDFSMEANGAKKINTTFFALFGERNIYSYEIVKKFISLIEQAEKDIEKYKVLDPDLYDVVMDRIGIEAVSYYYMMLQIYGNSAIPAFDDTVKMGYKNKLYNILINYPSLPTQNNGANPAIDICK